VNCVLRLHSGELAHSDERRVVDDVRHDAGSQALGAHCEHSQDDPDNESAHGRKELESVDEVHGAEDDRYATRLTAPISGSQKTMELAHAGRPGKR
jgi:hypothetical protein